METWETNRTPLIQKPYAFFEAGLLWVAWVRGCVPTLEQPRGSKLIIHPALQALVKFFIDLQNVRVFGNLAAASLVYSAGKFSVACTGKKSPRA